MKTSSFPVGSIFSREARKGSFLLSKRRTILSFTASLFLLVTSSYCDITTGLITRLKFDETSGTTAADATGKGHTGTLVNGPVFVSGRMNNAVKFD